MAYWQTPDELGKEATFSLLHVKKSKPAIGWVKADRVSTETAELEIAALKQEISEKKLMIERLGSGIDIVELNHKADLVAAEFVKSAGVNEFPTMDDPPRAPHQAVLDRVYFVAEKNVEISYEGISFEDALLGKSQHVNFTNKELTEVFENHKDALKNLIDGLLEVGVLANETGLPKLTSAGHHVSEYRDKRLPRRSLSGRNAIAQIISTT